MKNVKMFAYRHAGKIVAAASIGAVIALASPAHAQYVSTAFSTTTAVTNTNQFFTDIDAVIGGVIVGILTLLAAMLGLGWGVKKFRHYITGRKF